MWSGEDAEGNCALDEGWIGSEAGKGWLAGYVL